MGICSKVRDIIANKSDVPVDTKDAENDNEKIEQVNDEQNIPEKMANNENSQLINNNNNNNKENNITQNTVDKSKEEEKSNNNKLSDININQQIINGEVEEDQKKSKKNKKVKIRDNSKKKMSVQFNGPIFQNGLKEHIRGKSSDNNYETSSRKEQSIKKFQRSAKKMMTFVNMDANIKEKLKGVEMKIPVLQETLIIKKTGDPDKYYKKIKDLGSGSYGHVYKAKNIIMDNIVAIKVIEKVQDNVVDDLEIKNEITILKKLSHPNIVKIYEFFDTTLYYYIVTEYCKKGELFSYIKNRYSERQLAVLFYQVFSGLYYLHENRILHRDLKLENLMVSEIEEDVVTGESYFWIKIIDFGTAKIFQKNKTEKAVIGSSYYIAPEVLKQKYNEKCDTWSTGVILFMTLVGVAPFDGRTDEEIIKKIKIGQYNKNDPRLLKHSSEVRDLVSKLLEKDINKRLSAKEALNHPWFDIYGGRSLFSNFKPEDIQPYIDNLFNYKYNSKLQELVIAFLVHNLSYNVETHIILKMFRYFNKSGNCKLTKNELTKGLYNYREKKEVDPVVDHIFQLLDGDNNGYIEYEEFLRACIDKKALMTTDNLKYAFKFLDKENSKTLDVQKIISAFLTKPNRNLETIFLLTIQEVDRDNDGIINFEEFQELMTKI